MPELAAPVDPIDVTACVSCCEAGAGTVMLDLARSVDFRDGHIHDAIWGVRGAAVRR